MRLLFPVSVLLGSILVAASESAASNSSNNKTPDITSGVTSKNETETHSTTTSSSGIALASVSTDPDETDCALGNDSSCPKCADGEKLLRVLIHTDAYPEQTYWSVKDTGTNVEVMSVSEGDYTESETSHGHVMCVPKGRYKFTIWVRALTLCVFVLTCVFPEFINSISLCAYILYYHQDSWGDGLCSEGCCGEDDGCGYYKFIYGDQEVSAGGNFGYAASETFGIPTEGALACIFGGNEEFCPTCSKNEKLMKVLVYTDFFPGETSWSVRDACTDEVIMSVTQGDYTEHETEYGHVMCVPEGPYKFTIRVRA
jgi:hypothetical protein